MKQKLSRCIRNIRIFEETVKMFDDVQIFSSFSSDAKRRNFRNKNREKNRNIWRHRHRPRPGNIVQSHHFYNWAEFQPEQFDKNVEGRR